MVRPGCRSQSDTIDKFLIEKWPLPSSRIFESLQEKELHLDCIQTAVINTICRKTGYQHGNFQHIQKYILQKKLKMSTLGHLGPFISGMKLNVHVRLPRGNVWHGISRLSADDSFKKLCTITKGIFLVRIGHTDCTYDNCITVHTDQKEILDGSPTSALPLQPNILYLISAQSKRIRVAEVLQLCSSYT